jgi:hypothetical protein
MGSGNVSVSDCIPFLQSTVFLAAISENTESPTKVTIRKWLNKSEALLSILIRYGDESSMAELNKRKEKLNDILDAMGLDGKGRDKMRKHPSFPNGDMIRLLRSGLPKALREALELLASEKLIAELAEIVQDQLRLSSHDPELGSIPEIIFDRLPDTGWSEGVEDFKDKDSGDLWSMLGFSDESIPFFNGVHDPYGNRDPWNKEEEQWFEDTNNTEPLKVRWHQQVGIAKMIQRAFEGKPVLLMDEVGLGKTLQIAGTLATLAFYREYYAVHERFPGAYGGGKFCIAVLFLLIHSQRICTGMTSWVTSQMTHL